MGNIHNISLQLFIILVSTLDKSPELSHLLPFIMNQPLWRHQHAGVIIASIVDLALIMSWEISWEMEGVYLAF